MASERKRLRLASVAAAVTILAAGCAIASSIRLAGVPANVTIDPDRRYQVMQGFGSSNRVWDDPHVSNTAQIRIPAEARTEILARLYQDLGLTRVRPVIDGDIEPSTATADP